MSNNDILKKQAKIVGMIKKKKQIKNIHTEKYFYSIKI